MHEHFRRLRNAAAILSIGAAVLSPALYEAHELLSEPTPDEVGQPSPESIKPLGSTHYMGQAILASYPES
jgi:hypothetical protein